MSSLKPSRSKSAGRGLHRSFRGGISPRITEEAKQAAEKIARQICEKTTPFNLDLKCVVLGVTPRGGFKLNLSRVEIVSDTIISEWKSLCRESGFNSVITYNTVHAKATIHATRGKRAIAPTFGCVDFSLPAHPLTLLFGLLLVANTLRKFVV